MSEQYRTKPAAVEAMRLDLDNGITVATWCGGQYHVLTDAAASPPDVRAWVEIQTIDGPLVADVGDYVVKGVQGDFYPRKAAAFDATYEPITESEDTP
ncbi:hypothetical protein [Cellulomonas uda]|uniref:Uncharacterized protein n=1 Tax=Cellulomonas uda TaxID=1714 RepID=A0A4Y3K885_CELUD|nr:hypothetical protein [Cellulomonas uda]NII67827.1 hypothetical protein [Cellulomonas uda]GEA79926.1 hypothetical protein CUD01_03700 [Cellulomonas uda]